MLRQWLKVVAVALAALMLIAAALAEDGEPGTEGVEKLDIASIEPMDWEAFSKASSDMVREYADRVQVEEGCEAYRSGRLIVRVDGPLPDLSQFDPVAAARDEEGHYLLQFVSAMEAQACSGYLSAFPEVVYVEPDQDASAYDASVEG